MPDFAADLNEVLKFAAAPAQGIGSFVRAAHGNSVHHTNVHDLVLADYLTEHDDPRGDLLVRRHLERTKTPVKGNESYQELQNRLGTYDIHQVDYHHQSTPDGEVHFDHYINPETEQRLVRVQWIAKHPDQKLSGRMYHAVLTPAEAHHLSQNLPMSQPTKPPVEVS